MAKKKEADTPTADETTPPVIEGESEEVKTEAGAEVPEGDATGDAAGEKTAVEQTMDAFLKDEADDLDLDPAVKAVEEVKEDTPPEGPEPEKKAEEEPKPVEAPPEVAPTPPAEPKKEEAPPTPAPVEVKPAPTPPTAPVAAPAEPTPEPVPAAPAMDMDEVRKNYQENRQQMVDMVATSVYNLSEEQVQRLDDGDTKVISEIAARVYMDAVTGATAHMITHLPQMVHDVLAGRDKTDILEKQFYDSNPALDKAKHGETVSRFGVAYRSLFPQASSADFIRDVGAQTMVALQINPPGNSGTPPTVVPEAPKVPAFQPASAGGGKGAAPAPSNPFEVLAEEMNLEELGET